MIGKQIVICKDVIAASQVTNKLNMSTVANIKTALRDNFNTIIMNMTNYIHDHYSDNNPSIVFVKSMLNVVINRRPNKPISYFLIHVYKNDKYRKNILAENDKYFVRKLNKCGSDRSDESSRSSESYEYDTTNIFDTLFAFNNLWSIMDDDSKNFIKRAMKCLILISNKYILAL